MNTNISLNKNMIKCRFYYQNTALNNIVPNEIIYLSFFHAFDLAFSKRTAK